MREMVRIAKGDNTSGSGRSCEMKLKILKSFEPLIKKCIKIYIHDFHYYEDAMQEGYLTILKCIEMYDIDSRCEFPGYVKMAMINNIRDFSKKIKNHASLDEEIFEGGVTLLETIKSDVDIERDEIRSEEIIAMYRGIGKLTKKQREIIIEVFFKKLSMREVCKNRRCHYMTVVRLKDRALERLRDIME